MVLKKYRWSRHYEAAEEELVEQLASKKIAAERWHAEGYEELPSHKHEFDIKLWCVEGSVVFTANNQPITLQAGDGLDLPANTAYSATAGFSGCVCYESPPHSKTPRDQLHKQANSLF